MKSWNLVFRLLSSWGIRWWSQNRKIFKTWTHLWRHRVPWRPNIPNKGQMLISSQGNGMKRWNLAFRLLSSWGVRCWSQNRKLFKIGPTCDVTGSPGDPKYPTKGQMFITSHGNKMESWNLIFRLLSSWGIPWWSQNRKILKIWTHVWRHNVP